MKFSERMCCHFIIFFLIVFSISSCGSQKLQGEGHIQNETKPSLAGDLSSTVPTPSTTPGIDIAAVKPNEAGKVMIVMFHNFVAKYKSGDKYYTTTFDAFGKLLKQLYDSGYRLTSLSDYLNNNIKIAAGFKPIVFTFDDGTSGQFSLVEENGKLTASKQSAVGIMEEFNKQHPDFGLCGTLFVNLGDNTFSGKGSVAERLKYLIDAGFEIGNHTYTHINLKKAEDAEEIQKEIGGNQKRMYELVPGYKFNAFSLPFGLPSKELQQFVIAGIYEGVEYKNQAIMEVGWDPALSPVDIMFNPLTIHRVRASGIVPVDADLAWWLGKVKKESEYVSDGNSDTVSVPKTKEAAVDKGKLGNKKLIVY